MPIDRQSLAVLTNLRNQADSAIRALANGLPLYDLTPDARSHAGHPNATLLLGDFAIYPRIPVDTTPVPVAPAKTSPQPAPKPAKAATKPATEPAVQV